MGKYSDMFNEEVGHLRHDRETQEEQAKQKEREAARPLLEKVMPFLSAAKTDLEESGNTIDFNPRWDRPRDELQYLAFQLQRNIGDGVDIVQNIDQTVLAPFFYKYDWQGTKKSGSSG